MGSRVVIADWRCDWVGLGVAELLARQGCHVRLACNGMVPGQTINQYVRDNWLGTLHKLNVETLTHLRLRGVDSDDTYFQHTLSEQPVILNDVDTLVTAFGSEATNTLEKDLRNKVQSELYVIGDALSPRSVEEAILRWPQNLRQNINTVLKELAILLRTYPLFVRNIYHLVPTQLEVLPQFATSV